MFTEVTDVTGGCRRRREDCARSEILFRSDVGGTEDRGGPVHVYADAQSVEYVAG